MQQDAAYDKEAEQQAREWIETITGEAIGGSDFFDGLRDGSHLCRLVVATASVGVGSTLHFYLRLLNKLRPQLVPQKYETPTTQPFKQVKDIYMHDHKS